MLGTLAHGAIMGARGNSGVILAQCLRGMAQAATGHREADAVLIAALLRGGSNAAYAAVAEPVEGTILTVARAAADAASERAATSDNILDVLGTAHEAARDAVERTPDQLAILRQAGVVDAGGEGFRVCLEGLLKHLSGEPLEHHAATVTRRADLSAFQHADDAFGYCTEVLFRSNGTSIDELRGRVSALGTSVLVVGDQDLVKIHVHTLRPGSALDLATDLGEIVRVKVDNMRLQYHEFSDATRDQAHEREPGTSIVAIALGEGFQEIFTSLGALVVPGGQTMNPAVGDILAAIHRAPRQHVLVLPNNENVALAAGQAATAAQGCEVVVVPTATMPQGVAAALAVSPDEQPDLAGVHRAVDRCRTIEVTRAVRQAEINGVRVEAGSWIARIDGELMAGPSTLTELVERALTALPSAPYELATVYLGAPGNDEEAESLRTLIASRLRIAVETARGGQPHYAYIISVE
jgi:DAK2 domain fusion protein YloV